MCKPGLLSYRSLLHLFLLTSALLILSWLSVLRSTARPYLPHSSTAALDREQKSPIKNPRKCDPNRRILKVFMYDLPPVCHFGLMGWMGKGPSVWPDVRAEIPEYPGGLNLQHSVEYWLTLDLLSSEFSEDFTNRSAIRVRNVDEADIVFVPFFASIIYNIFAKKQKQNEKSPDDLLQEKLVEFLIARDEWKRSSGRDHVIVAHHPNSLLHARLKLWQAMFVLADFGRYSPTVANVDKDIIAPYKHLVQSYEDDKSSFDSRPTLLYFQGAIYRKADGIIRQELYYMLRDEKDVHFAFGSIKGDGIKRASQGMQSSKFCLNIAGDTPSSNRLFDAIASHCVPVVISDDIELPYEDVLDYSEFCIFVQTSDALKGNFLISLIRGIGREEWTTMWRRLKEVEHHFQFQDPSRRNDAVQMIWQAMSRKVPATTRKIHGANRLPQATVGGDGGLISAPIPRNFW